MRVARTPIPTYSSIGGGPESRAAAAFGAFRSELRRGKQMTVRTPNGAPNTLNGMIEFLAEEICDLERATFNNDRQECSLRFYKKLESKKTLEGGAWFAKAFRVPVDAYELTIRACSAVRVVDSQRIRYYTLKRVNLEGGALILRFHERTRVEIELRAEDATIELVRQDRPGRWIRQTVGLFGKSYSIRVQPDQEIDQRPPGE